MQAEKYVPPRSISLKSLPEIFYVSYGDNGFSFLDEANGDYCYLQDGTLDTTDDSFELLNRDLYLEI